MTGSDPISRRKTVDPQIRGVVILNFLNRSMFYFLTFRREEESNGDKRRRGGGQISNDECYFARRFQLEISLCGPSSLFASVLRAGRRFATSKCNLSAPWREQARTLLSLSLSRGHLSCQISIRPYISRDTPFSRPFVLYFLKETLASRSSALESGV